MTREERIDRLRIGIIRTLNGDQVRGWYDRECLWTYGDAARPFAEALLDVIEDVNRPRVGIRTIDNGPS